MYFNIHSGCSSHPWDSPLRGLRSVSLPAKRSSAPAEHDLPALATIFSQALRVDNVVSAEGQATGAFSHSARFSR
ncbi:MAG: hypothetical protein ACRED0_12425, partial [Gammaproteobacteria bacterium]